MTHKGRILIAEDDEPIATGLHLNLKLAGYEPLVADDGDTALEMINVKRPALVLLDLNLPKRDGLEVLHELRRNDDYTPVIIVSARQDEFDKVGALRLGADDYVTKPFALAELLARIDAVLRRVGAVNERSQGPITEFGNVRVEIDTHQISRGGDEVRLTHLEFELLSFFLHHPNRVFSRDQLLQRVWGTQSGSKRTVDNFVGQLRGKLESDPENPVHFITVRGAGYRFDSQPKE